MLITYINSAETISDVESLMDYLHFNAIESNHSYRVFSGNIKMNLSHFVGKIRAELEYTNFDVEDSMFIVYPTLNDDGRPGMSNIVLKRKGNKYLRRDKWFFLVVFETLRSLRLKVIFEPLRLLRN